MIAALGDLNTSIWSALEDRLTPLPKGSNESRILHHLPSAVIFPAGILVGSLTALGQPQTMRELFSPVKKKPIPAKSFPMYWTIPDYGKSLAISKGRSP